MKLIIAENSSALEKLSLDSIEGKIVTDLKNAEKELQGNEITTVQIAIPINDFCVVMEREIESESRITSLNMEKLERRIKHLNDIYSDRPSDKKFYLKQNSPLIKY